MAAPPWSLSVAQTVALIEEKLAAAGYDHTVDRAALHAGTAAACYSIAPHCCHALLRLLRGTAYERPRCALLLQVATLSVSKH